MTVCCLIWIQVNIQNYGFHANRASDMLMLVEMSGRTGGWAIVLSSPSVIPLVFLMLPSTTGYENLSLQRRSESLEAPLSLFCSHLHKSFWISHPPPSAVDYDFCHVNPAADAAERVWFAASLPGRGGAHQLGPAPSELDVGAAPAAAMIHRVLLHLLTCGGALVHRPPEEFWLLLLLFFLHYRQILVDSENKSSKVHESEQGHQRLWWTNTMSWKMLKCSIKWVKPSCDN